MGGKETEMAEFEDKMVLRTVYLPFDLDQELRSIAFRDNRSKNDLIRELIKSGIETAKKGDDRRFKFVPPKRKPVPTAKIEPRSIGEALAPKGKAPAAKGARLRRRDRVKASVIETRSVG
jgi:hypothetical protein